MVRIRNSHQVRVGLAPLQAQQDQKVVRDLNLQKRRKTLSELF
jgi:hypothetical protein